MMPCSWPIILFVFYSNFEMQFLLLYSYNAAVKLNLIRFFFKYKKPKIAGFKETIRLIFIHKSKWWAKIGDVEIKAIGQFLVLDSNCKQKLPRLIPAKADTSNHNNQCR